MNNNPVLKTLRLISLILLFGLMLGCAKMNADWRGKFSGDRRTDTYAQSDLNELLSFGEDFSNQSSARRADICRTLLNRQKEAPGEGVQLHLMMGRLLSDACGDIPKIVAGVESIPPRNLPDDPVRSLVAIQTEALKRMNHASRRLGAFEHKQKSVQVVLESKEPKESKGAKKDEARLLREKLEAIRAMEKKLDETSGVN